MLERSRPHHKPSLQPGQSVSAPTPQPAGLGLSSVPARGHAFSQIAIYPAPVALQPKLTANTSGDAYEQEADRVSQQVMCMSAPRLQRTCACGGRCPKCQTEQLGQEHEHLQPTHARLSDLGQTSVPSVHQVLRSPGEAFDPPLRASMKPSLGHDFSRVRVHADTRVAESAQVVNAMAYTPVQTTVLQRQDERIPKLDLPPSEEETSTRSSYSAHETVPPDCKDNSLVLSWEEDTCCSNRGFPDAEAKNKTTGTACCNTFPRFVDTAATKRGFDGAASCKPKYKEYSATVTPNDKSKPTVKVICTDTRANNNNVIELGEQAALKAYGSARLKERARVCYGTKESGTCYVETDCNKTTHPKESQCLAPGCEKTVGAGDSHKQDKSTK